MTLLSFIIFVFIVTVITGGNIVIVFWFIFGIFLGAQIECNLHLKKQIKDGPNQGNQGNIES